MPLWRGLRAVGDIRRRSRRPDLLGAARSDQKLGDVRRTQRAWLCPAPRVLGSLLVLVQLNWSSPSWAWTLEGHRLIAMDALAVLPPPMREALTPHVSAILAGVGEPDFYRIVSHKISIISLRGTPPPPRSGAADALQQVATNAQEMLRLRRSLEELLFVQGQATHFVQDLNQPLHAAWGETRAEHNEVEAQMLYRSWQKDHTYRGFMLVKNYSCFAFEIAQNSSHHARALFFDREIKRVTEIAWDQAVNEHSKFLASGLLARPGAGAGVAALRDPSAGQGGRKWIALLISRSSGLL